MFNTYGPTVLLTQFSSFTQYLCCHLVIERLTIADIAHFQMSELCY